MATADEQRARYHERKLNEDCVACGADLAEDDGNRCARCTELQRVARQKPRARILAARACKRWRRRQGTTQENRT